MMGRLERSEPLFCLVRLEELVPADHLLRRVDRELDLSPLVERLRPYYAGTGRPSIDPELMLRMLLVGYLYGIRSERRLVEEVRLNLAYRWFCRLALNGVVPDASTFSKNRHGRFRDADIFRHVFELIVERCVATGLATGEALSVDGSFLQADASPTRRVDGATPSATWSGAPEARPRPVRDYLAALDAAAGLPTGSDAFVPKHISLTDPQAAWSRTDNLGQFGYKAHFLLDNECGVILDVEGTDARLSNEIVAARRMLDRRPSAPRQLAADKSYGTGAFLGWLVDQGIEPMVPVLDRTGQTRGMFTRERFTFDAEHDMFVCPSGRELRRVGVNEMARADRYRASPRDCRRCSAKPACTSGAARKIERNWDEAARDHARALAGTEMYRVAARARRKVEARFAQLKNIVGLRRLRLRGLGGVREQVLLAGTALNLRSLARSNPA